jgi:hypothetical protein
MHFVRGQGFLHICKKLDKETLPNANIKKRALVGGTSRSFFLSMNSTFALSECHVENCSIKRDACHSGWHGARRWCQISEKKDGLIRVLFPPLCVLARPKKKEKPFHKRDKRNTSQKSLTIEGISAVNATRVFEIFILGHVGKGALSEIRWEMCGQTVGSSNP